MSTTLENIVDNALVIHDYNGFNIWVNGQKAFSNVAANDGKWHHMAFTWQSSTGQWKAYKDGSSVRQNDVSTDAFQTGQVGGLSITRQLLYKQETPIVSTVCSKAFIFFFSRAAITERHIIYSDFFSVGKSIQTHSTE